MVGKTIKKEKEMTKIYEWMAMSDWLDANKGTSRVPEDDGWSIVGGALRKEVGYREDPGEG